MDTGVWLLYIGCVANVALERRIEDWQALRRALGLTQSEMAELLCISRRQVVRLEQKDALQPHKSTVMLLRTWLQEPEFRRRLAEAGYPYPFPEDIAS